MNRRYIKAMPILLQGDFGPSHREEGKLPSLPKLGAIQTDALEVDVADLLIERAGTFSDQVHEGGFLIRTKEDALKILDGLGATLLKAFGFRSKAQSILLRFDRIEANHTVIRLIVEAISSVDFTTYIRADEASFVFVNPNFSVEESLHIVFDNLNRTGITLTINDANTKSSELCYVGKFPQHLQAIIEQVLISPNSISATDLAEKVGIQQKDITGRLKYLYDCGLIKRYKEKYKDEKVTTYKYHFFDPRKLYSPVLPDKGKPYTIYTPPSAFEEWNNFGSGFGSNTATASLSWSP